MKVRAGKFGVFMAAALLLTVSVGGGGASAASASVSEAQQKKEELQSGLAHAQELIDQLKADQGDLQSAVKELDRELTDISMRMTDIEQQTEEKNQELAETQEQLALAEEQESDQYESMKVRIRYMYENSGMTYLEAFISADSFADFIRQADYISMIVNYDRRMLEEYQRTQETIRAAKEQIEQDKNELQELQAQLEEEEEAVNLLMAEKESQLASVQSGLNAAESEAEQYQAQIAAEDQLIREMQAAEAEARKAETEGGESSAKPNVDTSNSYTGGAFTWPLPASSRITSPFGKRNAPMAGASTYHRGIDIGAPSGSAIVAAADGVVTTVGYNNSQGNYVTVSHGGGLFTVYCHCSAILVSSGQSVSRGSTIAKVGSTGVSTAPHLHFAVQVNGSYVDPMGYL